MNLSFSTEEQNIFFTSDTHFEHQNILSLVPSRPFPTVAAMNEALVQNWNAVVTENDIVFHLGDVYFSGGNATLGLLDQLSGQKFLVPGNHDDSTKLRKLAEFFTILPREIKIKVDARVVTLCHQPLTIPGLLLHGHLHGESIYNVIPRKDRGKPGVVGTRQKPPLKTIDVGVDAWKYTPVNWKKIWSLV